MFLLGLCHILQYGDPAALKTLAPVFRPSPRLFLEKTLQELSLQPGSLSPHSSLYLRLPDSQREHWVIAVVGLLVGPYQEESSMHLRGRLAGTRK